MHARTHYTPYYMEEKHESIKSPFVRRPRRIAPPEESESLFEFPVTDDSFVFHRHLEWQIIFN
jgi:hypothetical protein